MNSDEFDKLLDLYLKGRLSATQKAELEKLLDEYQKPEGPKMDFTQDDATRLWKRIEEKTRPADSQRPSRWPWMPMAAALLLATFAAVLVVFWNAGSNTQLSNKTILPDGSIVWLREGAALTSYPFSGNSRDVSLTGEALFEVAHDPGRPFVIHCGKYTASVVGTSFNIKASDSVVELTVLTGKVKLASTTSAESVMVSSRQHVIFSETKGLERKPDAKTEEIEHVLADTQYNMHFEDTRMSEIVKRVEGKFDVTVEVQSDQLLNCMISADFTDQSLPVTLTMISEALGVDYEISGSTVTLRGAGCPK
ncbi:MAG TPA: FecR domain-containing protein [Cyclobacteriaceae bacterium]|nr:FecR domain-containing protein [Cyclobacteriaceae bacterium]